MTGKEKLEKRAELVEQARAIHAKAEAEKRDATAEEREQFDKIMDAADELKKQADQLLRLETIEAEQAESRGRQTELEQADKPSGNPAQPETRVIDLRPSVAGDCRKLTVLHDKAVLDYENAFKRALLGSEREIRALQKDSDVAGGYLSAPLQFQAELIQTLDNLVWMRQISRVLPPLATADSLGAPSLDADPADPTWTSELAIGSEDSTMAFGKRELKPHPLAQFIKVSKTLLRRSTISVDAIVRDRLAYKCAVVEENAFLNGSGASQPLGVFTASNDGISTSRDVSTGNTTTEIRFDGLMEVVYKLEAQYRRLGCAWIFHRDAVKQIRKLKDGDGQYIWDASVLVSEPDRILSYPVYESEYAPNTFTTGLYVGILGNFQQYWIVDALTMTIQVLLELYAATNQNGYISRLECDGMPVLENAFARVKLA